MESFIPNYIMPNTQVVNSAIVNMARALYKEDLNTMFSVLQSFLATIPYTDNTQYEGHYQQVLLIIFRLLGAWADVEVHTPAERVDIVMMFKQKLYLIEMKLDSSAQKAMAQIDLKDYAAAFGTCGYPVVKVAVNFNSQTRNISDWIIS